MRPDSETWTKIADDMRRLMKTHQCLQEQNMPFADFYNLREEGYLLCESLAISVWTQRADDMVTAFREMQSRLDQTDDSKERLELASTFEATLYDLGADEMLHDSDTLLWHTANATSACALEAAGARMPDGHTIHADKSIKLVPPPRRWNPSAIYTRSLENELTREFEAYNPKMPHLEQMEQGIRQMLRQDTYEPTRLEIRKALDNAREPFERQALHETPCSPYTLTAIDDATRQSRPQPRRVPEPVRDRSDARNLAR